MIITKHGTGSRQGSTLLLKIPTYSMNTDKYIIQPSSQDTKSRSHKIQPILYGHPIAMQQSTSTTILFAWPHGAKSSVIRNPYKVAMLKYVKYRSMPQADTEVLVHHMIIISITSKQWGARADLAGVQPSMET
jgi:hypothetical protein